MKYEKSCGAIVIKDNKVLIIKQNNGFYGFPKGHVEKMETEKETAIREVKEETNIDIRIISDCRYQISYMVDDNTEKTVVFFLAEPLTNDIICEDAEVVECLWLNFNDAIEILSYKDLKGILNKAKEDL